MRFDKAVSGAYNCLFYPGDSGELDMATIDNGLTFGEGEHAAEAQIERLLASSRCDNKLARDMADDLPTYWAMAETDLWPAKDHRAPWREVVMRARTDPAWPRMPGARGLQTLRDEALKPGRWRQTSEGHIEKKPFPPERTSVNITVVSADRETGETTLTLPPRNAGDSPGSTCPPVLRWGVCSAVGRPGGLPDHQGHPVLAGRRSSRKVPGGRAPALDRRHQRSASGRDYGAVMASTTPNAARLKALRELKLRDLTDRTEIGATPLGALIVAIQEFLADKDPEGVMANLREALVDYLDLRPRLMDMADFIAAKARDPETRRAAEAIANRIRNQRLQ